MAKIRKRIELSKDSDFTNVCVFACLRLFAYFSPTGFLSTILFASAIFTNLRDIHKEKYSSKSLWTHYHKRPQCSSFTEKLMHETISLGQQKVFIQSHKHSFQGSFFSSVTLNSFDTKAFVCLQTEFSVLLIVFFPSSTYDEFCAEQKR